MHPSSHPPTLDDTQPRLTVRPPDEQSVAGWRRAVGWFSLLGAMLLTMATLVLLLLPPNSAEPMPTLPATEAPAIVQQAPTQADAPMQAALMPAATDVLPDAGRVQLAALADLPPVVTGEQLVGLLATPFAPQPPPFGSVALDPFTVIPDRPRSEFVEYTIQPGDTIFAISRRYGLAQETLAWCNDREIIFVLRPGNILRIPPTDGACHTVLGTRQLSIADIAAQYDIDDPYQVIESPYNPQLYGYAPDDTLPGGVVLFLPGGVGPDVTWNPGYETETDATGNVSFVTFASGQPGSCGRVPAAGGTAWNNPLPNGRWVRGFSVGHTGIDLAASVGTPIYAANGGPVLFSGFSRWGYGEAVVLAHGRFSTLYGHMSSRVAACGQNISVGQVVGYVGSTGNSSGPHLHFEIRFNDEPQDPTATPGIGW